MVRFYNEQNNLRLPIFTQNKPGKPENIIIIIIIIVCLIKTSSGSQKTELHDVKCYKVINSKKILYYNAI